MNEAIELAIRGGYKSPLPIAVPHNEKDEMAAFLLTKEMEYHFFPLVITDPLFWQALGKALGWKKNVCGACGSEMPKSHFVCQTCFCDYTEPYQTQVPEWKYYKDTYFNIIDYGENTEKFWHELLNQNQ